MILKCPNCKDYTLDEFCKVCKAKTRSPHPMKFTITDKYGKYRRMAKEKFKSRE